MTTRTAFDFQWISRLGIAAVLFLSHGRCLIIAGLLVFWLYRKPGSTKRNAGWGGLILSARAVSALLGRPVAEIVQEDQILTTVVDLIMNVSAGLWLAFGIFETALVWLDVREGTAWAFWTVVLATLAVLASWASVSWQFIRCGVRLGFDLPPVAFIYAAMITPIAAVLGWVGLGHV
jgi:hypothetical protein